MADEIGAPPDSWETADLEESVSRLMISSSSNDGHTPALGFVDDDSAVATSSSSSSSSSAATPVFATAPSSSSEDLAGHVDQFLREALQKPRERLSILRMEQDIVNFLRDPRQQQLEFQALPTSYLRLAAHRIAQHYSLQSIAVPDNSMPDGSGSRIMILKTPECHFPSVRLADIPVSLPQEENSKIFKVAIKQRAQKCSQAISSSTSNPSKDKQPKSVEQRKEEYNRARARIFSANSYVGGVKSDNEPALPDNFQHISAVLRQSEERALPEAPDTNMDRHVGESSTNNSRPGGARVEPMVNRQKATNKVAILRDREVDRKDPDYDRSYDRYMQRFDPGFGFTGGTYSMQPLYSPVVNYNTEFPQLGSGRRPQISIDHHARQMPQHLCGPWGASSTPTTHAYHPSESIMSPFSTNNVPVHSTSSMYLHSPQYVASPHPGMSYLSPHEHVQPFTQTHPQQTDPKSGLARPR